MYSKIFSGFRVKLDKQSQTGTLKSREWKSRHQNARLEIAGVEIAEEGKRWKATVLKMCF